MWQVLLGIYIVVILVSVIFIWASLVLAKKSDQNTERRERVEFTRSETRSKNDQAVEIPAMSELSQK